MYKILVADDEPFVRLALKSLTDWEAHGFRFEYEASNGRQALSMFDHKNDIDILIIDMNMPVMHGIELIEKIRNKDKTIPIIVLSAYNDYNFVRRAFKLGITDYILKVDMNAERMLILLKDAVKQIDITNKPLESEMKTDTLKILKENFLRNLIFLKQDNLNLEADMIHIGINPDQKQYQICFLWIDDFYQIKDRYKENTLDTFAASVREGIRQVLTEHQSGEILMLSPQEYILFLFNNQKIDRNDVSHLLNAIKHNLKNFLNIEFSIGVSSSSCSLENIHELYKEAEKCARWRYVQGKNKIIFYDTINRELETVKKNVQMNIEPLIQRLNNHEYEEAEAEFEILLSDVASFKPESIDKIYDLYLRLIFIIINHLTDLNEDIIDIFEQDISFSEEISRFETVEEIQLWLKNIVHKIFIYLKDKRKTLYSRPVILALKYLKNHFKDKELTMKTVSDHVELSGSHFSHLFTKETGENFTEYLTKMRINEAKRLLKETSLKVYEICFQIGYDNVEHFSRIFKKITGKSPHNFNKI